MSSSAGDATTPPSEWWQTVLSTPPSPELHLVHLSAQEPVDSTQDEVRRRLPAFLQSQQDPLPRSPALAVSAAVQTKGRGTQGRTWSGTRSTSNDSVDPPVHVGNMYLTVAVPRTAIPITLSLFPLQVGVLLAQRVQGLLAAAATPGGPPPPSTVVKWPNDVLVGAHKIAGILIESEVVGPEHEVYLLVGMGLNVAYAPALGASRPATCLAQHSARPFPDDLAARLATDVAHALVQWIYTTDRNLDRSTLDQSVVQAYKSWARWGEIYQLRQTSSLGPGEAVVTVDLEPDGQLRVQGPDGRERLLCAEYLW